MKKRFYFDTSVWRDYYENRTDSTKKLGDLALNLMSRVIKMEHQILYSDLVVEELMTKYNREEISNIFSILYRLGLLIKVLISKEQAEEAGRLCKERKIPFGDVLHAVLARDNNAVMVTRDKHFQQLKDIAEIKKPEEML